MERVRVGEMKPAGMEMHYLRPNFGLLRGMHMVGTSKSCEIRSFIASFIASSPCPELTPSRHQSRPDLSPGAIRSAGTGVACEMHSSFVRHTGYFLIVHIRPETCLGPACLSALSIPCVAIEAQNSQPMFLDDDCWGRGAMSAPGRQAAMLWNTTAYLS